MKNSKLSNAYATMEYDGFDGIDISKTFSGSGGIKDLSDFRLRFDGALEKRGGLEFFTRFPVPVCSCSSIAQFICSPSQQENPPR